MPRKSKATQIREYVEANPHVLSDEWVIAEAGRRRNSKRTSGTWKGEGERPPTVVYPWNGKLLSLPEIARLHKLNDRTLRHRVNKQGLTLEEAVKIPAKRRGK